MKVKKLTFKFIFHLFNYWAIKIVNLSKKNRNLYILSNYKKKLDQFIKLTIKKNIINISLSQTFSKVLNYRYRLKKNKIEMSI